MRPLRGAFFTRSRSEYPVNTARGQGLLEDFILYEGKILDGRECYVSCLRKQVLPGVNQMQPGACPRK
jgi:hypothetical protein